MLELEGEKNDLNKVTFLLANDNLFDIEEFNGEMEVTGDIKISSGSYINFSGTKLKKQ